MCSIRLFPFMAKGWRGYLEEESEFQWIAMAGFLIFILLGAIAIQGTSNLPGVEVGANNATHQGARVLDITYTSDDAFTARIVTSDGVELYQQPDSNSAIQIISASNGVGADNIQFLTTLENGNTVISPAKNTLQVIHSLENDPGQEPLISTLEVDNSTGNFSIVDLAEASHADGTSWMMVTKEGKDSTLRGLGTIGDGASSANSIGNSMSASSLSPAMSNSANVVWQDVAALEGDLWVASGYRTYTGDGGDSSPASPTMVSVVAVIKWSAGTIAPTVETMHVGEEGTFHTLLELSDSTVFAAGTAGSTHIDAAGKMNHLEAISATAVADDLDRVWLFGDVGSQTIHRISNGESEMLSLSRPLAFEAEASGFGTHLIFLHGTDDSGDVKTLIIDTTAAGSIESGRGFLNFMFMAVFTAVMLVMAWTVSNRFLTFQRR